MCKLIPSAAALAALLPYGTVRDRSEKSRFLTKDQLPRAAQLAFSATPGAADCYGDTATTYNSNSLGGLSIGMLAEASLEAATPYLAPIRIFSTDFSDDVRAGGESVTSRIPGIMTMGDVSGGFVAQDANSVSVSVTLNEDRGGAFKFTDLEIAKAKNNPDWLSQQFMKPAVEGMAADALARILGVFTTTYFNVATHNSSIVTAAQMSYSRVNKFKTALGKMKCKKTERVLILPSDYQELLLEDDKFLRARKGGNEALVEKGVFDEALGFGIFECNEIPTNGASNLAALCATPQAAAFAARSLLVPDMPTILAENLVHKETGLRYQLRAWYEAKEGAWYFALKYMAGAAAGVKQAAHLVRSAA